MKSQVSKTQRMLNSWAIALILLSIYRWYFETSLPIWLDEFIVKPLIFFVPIYYFISHEEDRPFWRALGFEWKSFGTNIGIGIGIGMILLFSQIIANYIEFNQIQPPQLTFLPVYSPFLLIAVAFATSFTEEALSRGFLLKRFLDYKNPKSNILSLIYSSILFVFLRIPMIMTNELISGYMILQLMAIDFFLSILLGYVFIQRRNIIAPIIIHFFYTISLYFLT